MDTYKIGWNESLSIGNKLIDSQHKMLIELIGAISEFDDSKDDAVLMAAIDYASYHFAAEERHMEKNAYPDIDEHKSTHKKLSKILWSYKRDYDQGKIDLYGFKQFMFCWIRDHIMEDDVKIGAFLHPHDEK